MFLDNIIKHVDTNTCITIYRTNKDNQIQYLTLKECNITNIYNQIEYWKNRLVFSSYCVQVENHKNLFIAKCLGEDKDTKYLQYFNEKNFNM